MKTFVESFSFTSGAVLIAIASSGIVWLLCFLSRTSFHKLWVIVVPFALSNCLYWSGAWFEAQGSEYNRMLVMADYRMWFLAFIVSWSLAGAIPSALVLRLFFGRRTFP